MKSLSEVLDAGAYAGADLAFGAMSACLEPFVADGPSVAVPSPSSAALSASTSCSACGIAWTFAAERVDKTYRFTPANPQTGWARLVTRSTSCDAAALDADVPFSSLLLTESFRGARGWALAGEVLRHLGAVTASETVECSFSWPKLRQLDSAADSALDIVERPTLAWETQSKVVYLTHQPPNGGSGRLARRRIDACVAAAGRWAAQRGRKPVLIHVVAADTPAHHEATAYVAQSAPGSVRLVTWEQLKTICETAKVAPQVSALSSDARRAACALPPALVGVFSERPASDGWARYSWTGEALADNLLTLSSGVNALVCRGCGWACALKTMRLFAKPSTTRLEFTKTINRKVRQLVAKEHRPAATPKLLRRSENPAFGDLLAELVADPALAQGTLRRLEIDTGPIEWHLCWPRLDPLASRDPADTKKKNNATTPDAFLAGLDTIVSIEAKKPDATGLLPAKEIDEVLERLAHALVIAKKLKKSRVRVLVIAGRASAPAMTAADIAKRMTERLTKNGGDVVHWSEKTRRVVYAAGQHPATELADLDGVALAKLLIVKTWPSVTKALCETATERAQQSVGDGPALRAIASRASALSAGATKGR